MADKREGEADTLYPECGDAFKIHMDPVFSIDEKGMKRGQIGCPVCGCQEYRIGE